MLSDPRIQSKVGLSPSQVQSVQKIVAQHSQWQTNQLQLPKPNVEGMADADKAASIQILHELTPEQTKALKKATFEVAGCTALLEPEVIKELKIQDSQKDKIEKILDEASEPTMKLEAIIARRISEDPSSAASLTKTYAPERARLAKQLPARQAKALSVLTATQAAAWKALTD